MWPEGLVAFFDAFFSTGYSHTDAAYDQGVARLEILGIMGWPLAACSIIALMICLERFLFWIRVYYFHKEQDYTRIANVIERSRDRKKELRDDIATVFLADVQNRYFSGVNMLRIIGTLAPLLGLLGTILGIIKVFQAVAAHSGPISPNIIADGLWEAMLTTAAGLLIALPALFMSYVFHGIGNGRLKRIQAQLNRLSLSFEHPELAPHVSCRKKHRKPVGKGQEDRTSGRRTPRDGQKPR